ncbi:histidine kinase [Streptomyces albogriseolus]|uniref:histidine kinase n=1 Tax=Streptomyces albogriseolus TaxID=1887 RepID=UPI003D74A65B
MLLATGAASAGAPFLGVEGSGGGESLLVFWGLALTVWLTAFALHTRRLYAESQTARARHAEREQEQRVRLAAARERAEIARELHDVVAHSLAVMILQADGAGAVRVAGTSAPFTVPAGQLAAVLAALVLVTAAAGTVPALRASRTPPTVAVAQGD